jgi:hypothetical protein
MFLLEENMENVALGVPRGLSGLNPWVRDPLFPDDFYTCGKCKFMAGMWVRKNQT